MKYLNLFEKEHQRTDDFKEFCGIPNISYAEDTSSLLVLQGNLQWFTLIYTPQSENILEFPQDLVAIVRENCDGKNMWLVCSAFSNEIKITRDNYKNYFSEGSNGGYNVIVGATSEVNFTFYIVGEPPQFALIQEILSANNLKSVNFSHFDLKNCIIDSTIGDNVVEVYFTKGSASNMTECILTFPETNGTIYFNNEDWDIVKNNIPNTWTIRTSV